jgi:hypothetical protein
MPAPVCSPEFMGPDFGHENHYKFHLDVRRLFLSKMPIYTYLSKIAFFSFL